MFSNFFSGKKILITGHTGFKGSWLATWLNHLGADVYGYALSPGNKDDNFYACRLEKNIHHKIGDIRNGEELTSFVVEVQPNIAFHLAAQPLVLKSYQDPVDTFSTNLMGTVNFFEAVRKVSSIEVAINVTSDKCYENKEWVWGYRENDPMGGNDPYSASKGCSELITNSYTASFFKDRNGCKIASARAGNVIGGGDWNENRIVPDFFRSIKNQTQLEIRNPNSTRPWQHVLEPLSGYLTLAMMLYDNSKFSGAWNFGPAFDNDHSVKDLIDGLINASKKGACIYSKDKQVFHEATLLKLDISKATRELKWKPVWDFEETINYTTEGYRVQLDDQNVLASRIEQLNQYHACAAKLGLLWAQ